MATTLDLSAHDLFGNDAAEDETEDVFESYAVKRSELERFTDPGVRLAVASAYKGEGKSALLRMARSSIASSTSCEGTPIVLHCPASALTPDIDTITFPAWLRRWKAAILEWVAAEIGRTVNLAWSDDAMGLVEIAEKKGFRSRSFVGSVLDRLTGGSYNGTTLPSIVKPGAADPGEALKRFQSGKATIWLFIDDVDENYSSSPIDKAKVGSFFSACRDITNDIPEIRIRTAIRPNVWTTVLREYESLSKVGQYLCPLAWSEAQIGSLLAHRIAGYLQRTGQPAMQAGKDEQTDKDLVALAFDSPMEWGRRVHGKVSTRPPHVVLYTLSKHRPRWVIELAKTAAASALSRAHSRVSRQDIIADYQQFGTRRIAELVAEFRAQCPQVGELFDAFSRGSEEMTTDDLLKVINNKIVEHMTPQIAGALGKPRAREIASFLFETGLYYARRDYPDGRYEHISFAEKPGLLLSRTNIDQGLKWEIHPVFRQALEIRNSRGEQIAGTRLASFERLEKIFANPPTPSQSRRRVVGPRKT